MKSINIHTKNAAELKTVKEDLLPEHVMKSIERSLEQFDNGNTISLEEFKAKHFLKMNHDE